MMQNKSNIIVIVGASKGIGKELVYQFAQNESNKIIALGRSKSLLKDFNDLKNVYPFIFDLNSPSCFKKLPELLKPFSEIDILINNAGILIKKPFLELQHQDFIDSYQVNTIGVMQTVQVILPFMLIKGGHIVNISSMGGFQGSVKFPELSAYSTSKAALSCFTEMFAEEFKNSKVKMNCLCLGAVQTEMLNEAFPGYKAQISAIEMAKFICDFAQSSNQFFNGKIIPVSLSTP